MATEKKAFDKLDKQRLAELVEAYMKPANTFKILGNGGVTVKGPSALFGWLSTENQDFLDVFMTLLPKVVAGKEDNNHVKSLCSDALGIVVTTGDRAKAVRKLYTAHLTDSEPITESIDDYERETEVEIQFTRQNNGHQIVKMGNGIKVSDWIADKLNRNNYIIFKN